MSVSVSVCDSERSQGRGVRDAMNLLSGEVGLG